jgi:propionyl-CoA carboxylase alpha chain
VLEAAVRTGCDAVHPGYGFLSENETFARRVTDAGIAFIGPPADAIALLGDKMTAKRTASKAGTPTVPGLEEPLTDAKTARKAAADIGYPVLLKPTAGGGGKGMRIVHSADEIGEALAACRAEAGKAFGDDRVFVEKYITRPRHIEIQVLADAHGNIVYLNERECSIQRRYQKVIEEAPSPFLDAELRARMGEAACKLARASGYVNAGTVEFIADQDRSFYFLEMNTRLQVEHPVTELTTGLDLVEHQLRIAAGEPLTLKQKDVAITGWAIEARVCAEDPERGFAPSTGTIVRYSEPRGVGIRIDSGVRAGSHIGVYYDSMLAKVIAHGESREAARLRLIDALNGYHVEGPSTNVDFANSILNHPQFVGGDLSTNFIAENYVEGRANYDPPLQRLHFMAIATLLVYHNRRALMVEALQTMAPSLGGVRAPHDQYDYVVKADSDVFRIGLTRGVGERRWVVDVDGERYDVATPEFEFYRRRLRLEINGQRERFLLRYADNFIWAAHCGIRRTFEIYSPREWELAQYMPEAVDEVDAGIVTCPMPGLVVAVNVGVGDEVHAGDVLLTLESMKMQSGVAAATDGRVAKIHVDQGQTVDAGDVLVELDK